jgi:FMN phosphatase YigB (HAD superfamily)
MGTHTVVLDFDGTFTDVEKESAPFLEVFRRDVADLVGSEALAKSPSWSELEAEIAAHPDRYGWEVGGRIVAPASADPYIRATCVAQLLFSHTSQLSDPETRSTVLQALYRKAYDHSASVFRPHARRAIEKLLDAGAKVYFVTNSKREKVEEKVAELLGSRALSVPILGDAQKFLVADPRRTDARFDGLAESKHIAGLDARPLYLRRGRYFDALAKIWSETQTGPEQTLVVGDIFELDLAMPAELGARVHLLQRADTPAYEKAAIDALGPRGSRSDGLEGIPTLTH